MKTFAPVRLSALLLGAALCSAGLSSGPAHAQGAAASSAIEFARQAETLRPGQWVWAVETAPEGPVLVYVDLGRQLATIYRNGVRIAVTTVSTGKPGHETPTGIFTILQKDAHHRSSTYNNAPMPYQQRLTWDGVALHAGGLPGYPESHGCVHLPMEFAKKLFATTDMGGTVIINGRAGSVAAVPAAGVLAAADEQGNMVRHDPLAADESYRWQPEAAPSGPVSIVVSRGDQRIVVLRNGIEIGRARATMPDNDFETHVFNFSRMADGKGHWMVAGVPGHGAEAGRILDPWVMAGVRMPAKFLGDIQSVLTPGASVLVTQAPVLPHHNNAGRSLTVLASAEN